MLCYVFVERVYLHLSKCVCVERSSLEQFVWIVFVDKMKLFSEEEVKRVHVLPKNELPLVIDCLKYVVTRTSPSANEKVPHHTAVSELAQLLHDLWMAADCCPMNVRMIIYYFENHVWEPYRQLIKEGLPGRTHRAKPKKLQNQQGEARERSLLLSLQVWI